MTSSLTSPLMRHFADIRTVAAFDGTDIPKKHRDITARFEALSSDASATDALTAGIITGQGDLTQLLLAAWTTLSASSSVRASVRADVEGPVFVALRDAYQPAALSNYSKIADEWTRHAESLHRAAEQVDIESDARTVVAESDEVRGAYVLSEVSSHRLTELLEPLTAAARLCGAVIGTPESTVPLVCDTSTAHRRRLWEAWDRRDGRTGRWGALIAAGIPLRAAPDPTALQDYLRPGPPVERWERRDGELGTHRTVTDPADVEYAELTTKAGKR